MGATKATTRTGKTKAPAKQLKQVVRKPKKVKQPKVPQKPKRKTKPANVPMRQVSLTPTGRTGSPLAAFATAPATGTGSVSFRSTNDPTSKAKPSSGVGRMNRAGTNTEKIMPGHKNLRPDPVGGSSENRAERWLQKNMKAEDLLPPNAVRYCNLLDDPLNAPWGDVGEVQVHPLIYDEAVPPSTTKTVRCFGQQELNIPAGRHAWVVLCTGAANVFGDDATGNDLADSVPNVFAVGGVISQACWTLGAPNDGRTGAANAFGGDGVAGYFYTETNNNPQLAPNIDTNTPSAANNSEMLPLIWGSPVPLGDMDVADSSTYKYRPVAGGILITPDDTTFETGGHFDAMVIPQATNEPYVRSASAPDFGDSAGEADVLALPDHCIQRGDDAISVNWLPGRDDYAFTKTFPAVDIFVDFPLLLGLHARNARVFIKITPPQNANAHAYVLSYTGFYEVSGRCVQQLGQVPRANPGVGAKIATSIQNNMNIELDDRSRQVEEGATLETMKDHPKIGPMIEECDSMPKAKSALSSVIEFGKDLLPLVGMFL